MLISVNSIQISSQKLSEDSKNGIYNNILLDLRGWSDGTETEYSLLCTL